MTICGSLVRRGEPIDPDAVARLREFGEQVVAGAVMPELDDEQGQPRDA